MTQLAERSVGHSEVVALLDEIRAKITNDRLSHGARKSIEDATDCIETLTKVYMIPDVKFDSRPCHLTKKERAIAEYLWINFQKTRTKEQILNALYWDRCDEAPEIKIVDVFVCKLRSKLKAANSPYAIETIWGDGYRMTDATDSNTHFKGYVAPVLTSRWGYWEGEEMPAALANLAAQLSTPLGAIVAFPTDKLSYYQVTSAASYLRRFLAGRYKITTIKGVGYKMEALEAVRA